MSRPYDLREGAPTGPLKYTDGLLLMLTPGARWSKCWAGPAYIYELRRCPGCGKLGAMIFAAKAEYTKTCRHCGWESDEEGEFKEPAKI